MASPNLPKPWKVSLMEFFSVGLVALVVGLMLGLKLAAKEATRLIKERETSQAIDRANYLFTLRRELANLLIWRDPRRYLQLFQELSSEFKSFESWRTQEINKRLLELSKKYPHYDDFDILGSKEYVLYADAVSWNNYEQLEAHYRGIATFVALSLIGDLNWKDAMRHRIKLDFQDGSEHLLDYVEQIKDTKLIVRIDQAMDAYFLHVGNQAPLDNKSFAVQPIYRSTPDFKYGIHLKGTNEFAIFSTFVFDDGRSTHSHYRSDSIFEKEDLLHANVALLDELKRPF